MAGPMESQAARSAHPILQRRPIAFYDRLSYDQSMSKNKSPVIIDLFAGVGGMSLGAARAGFDVRASVELDRIALATHKVNFPNAQHLGWDVATTNGVALLDEAGLKPGELDGLIGGPPCQGFSEIGKKSASDPRNALFGHFFRLVAETKPRFYVAENVPGILAERNREVVDAALRQIPSRYVRFEPTAVAANDHGAPTTRQRVFFIGYDPARMNALEAEALFKGLRHKAPTVGEALAGLPIIRCDWQTEEQGWRRVGDLPGGEFYRRLVDACPPGVGSAFALERLSKRREISGCLGTRHTEETVRRFSRLKPGQCDPVSRGTRLDLQGYCPTLRAGTGPDRGSFQAVRPIHAISPRVITPREAARLQGFPDWFQFHGTKWHSFRQIGNSVSPLLAESLLGQIFARL